MGNCIKEESYSQVVIVADCKNVPKAVKAINKLKPDLVFPDIAMHNYTGFELPDFFDQKDLNFRIIIILPRTGYLRSLKN